MEMDFFKFKNNFNEVLSIDSKLIYGIVNDKAPKLTIVIPTYKRTDLLKFTIESAINQVDFNDYEIVIVDNDVETETDTEKLIKNYDSGKILYYKNQKNLGMVGNWNKCIELARGELITILHDDDLLYPKFLTTMVGIIDKYNLNLLACSVSCGEEIKRQDRDSYKENKISKMCQIDCLRCVLGSISPFPGVIFRKELAVKLGGFSSEFYPISDYVFWTNYILKFGGNILNEDLAFYRVYNNSTTSKIYNEIINKSLEFKQELVNYCSIPKPIANMLIDVGMGELLNAYKIYTNLGKRSYNYKISKSIIKLLLRLKNKVIKI